MPDSPTSAGFDFTGSKNVEQKNSTAKGFHTGVRAPFVEHYKGDGVQVEGPSDSKKQPPPEAAPK